MNYHNLTLERLYRLIQDYRTVTSETKLKIQQGKKNVLITGREEVLDSTGHIE